MKRAESEAAARAANCIMEALAGGVSLGARRELGDGSLVAGDLHREAFTRVDLNGDGRVTAKELRNGLSRVPAEDLARLETLALALLRHRSREEWLKKPLTWVALAGVGLAAYMAAATGSTGPDAAQGADAVASGFLAVMGVAFLALVAVGLHNQLLAHARRKLLGAFDEVVAAAGVGLDGRALAATAIHLLGARGDRVPLGVLNVGLAGANLFTERQFLDAGIWGGEGRPGSQRELAEAFDRLPTDRRRAVATLVDHGMRTVTMGRMLYLGANTFVAFGLVGMLLAVTSLTGFWDKHGRWIPPQPYLLLPMLVVGGGFLGLAALMHGGARLVASRLPRSFARRLGALLDGA